MHLTWRPKELALETESAPLRGAAFLLADVTCGADVATAFVGSAL